MKPDTTLNLGDFQFGSLEIPAEIGFGGAQRLAVHELPGGKRVIDAMGRSDRPLEWSGLLVGKTAIERARYLDALRIGGLPQSLVWSAFSYTVVVREFSAQYQRAYQIPYRIVCEVVSDLTTPATSPGATPIDQQIAADNERAQTIGAKVADEKLTGLLGALDSAIAAVSSFASAAQSTINSVLQPLADVQARAQVLITATNRTIANVTTLGGVLPNNPLAKNAARLTSQVSAATQAANLYDLRNVLGRMGGNLGAVKSSPKSLPVAGGNLFNIAEQEYGDAAAWTGIAKANGLTDPFMNGSRTLVIPAAADSAGGVLAA